MWLSRHACKLSRPSILAEQLNLVAMTNKSMMYQDLTREMQRITSIFLERPRLRRYFYDNVEVPVEGEEREEVAIMVSEMFVDFISSSLNTNALFDHRQRTVWINYFQQIVRSSPAIRDFWDDASSLVRAVGSGGAGSRRAPTGVRRDEE